MKKLHLQIFIAAIFLLNSCSEDANGHFHLDWFGWFIILIIISPFAVGIVALIGKLINAKPREENANNYLKEIGIDPLSTNIVFHYVGGHPDLDEEFVGYLYKRDEEFVLLQHGITTLVTKFRSTIPIKAIKNILVDDRSSIEKKVTFGRVFLVGVFALAWTKDKKNEIAFLTIEWNDGKFDHSTVFAFHNANSMTHANTARNTLIKLIKQDGIISIN